jgi:UDP-N-acetylglucosamine--N-acetylmuramyl-(pentapeptide) pyrophosphoryl-undecaprenol N-acetylglucosamine transferase
MVTLLIAGGGTGGHVFPMIAVGDAALALEPAARVVYVGTERGIEARVMRERGDDIRMLDVAPLRGAGFAGFVKGVGRAAASIPEARKLVAAVAPHVVLSLGGYAAGPVSLAARTLGVPITILEPNSVLGLANRLLTPIAMRSYVAFPETEKWLRPSTILRAGVPLRRAFTKADYTPNARVRALVLGGSQGAKALNETVPEAIALALASGIDLEVVHQTGRDRDATVRALYDARGVTDRATVTPFIDDVAAALASADIVIARAGASSCAELCAVGRPGILIPFPFAADDHQRKNAESLERAGAAVALSQKEASAPTIAAEIVRLAKDPALRARMAAQAASLGKPFAARDIAADLLAIARHRSSKDQAQKEAS